MNPVTYAQELVRHQGWEKALSIAEGNAQTMKNALGSGAVVGFGDEVEMQEQTVKDKEGKLVTRMVTVVDERRAAARMDKTSKFWANVNAYLQKRKPAPKAA